MVAYFFVRLRAGAIDCAPMKLTDPLPRWVSWITRTIFWSVGVVLILGATAWYGMARLAGYSQECTDGPPSRAIPTQGTALAHAQGIMACLHGQSGPVEKALLWRTRRMLLAMPRTPCRYLGVWRSERPGSEYRVTLMEDGEFEAVPVKAPPDAGPVRGSWSHYGGRMVWIYREGLVFPPDVNVMKDASDSEFTLLEKDGSTTRFTMIERTASTTCTP